VEKADELTMNVRRGPRARRASDERWLRGVARSFIRSLLLGLSDPFCYVYTEDTYEARDNWRTVTRHGTVDPDWDERFDVEVKSPKEPIIFEVPIATNIIPSSCK